MYRRLLRKLNWTAAKHVMPALRYQRQFGPLADCYNEWSLITDLAGPGQAASDELIRLALEAISRTAAAPPDFIGRRVSTPITTVWPGEHYRLLPRLCDTFSAKRVVEIGTTQGDSSTRDLVLLNRRSCNDVRRSSLERHSRRATVSGRLRRRSTGTASGRRFDPLRRWNTTDSSTRTCSSSMVLRTGALSRTCYRDSSNSTCADRSFGCLTTSE